MLKSQGRQGSFYDADYICEQLIPKESFFRKFKELVWPLIKDEDLAIIIIRDTSPIS